MHVLVYFFDTRTNLILNHHLYACVLQVFRNEDVDATHHPEFTSCARISLILITLTIFICACVVSLQVFRNEGVDATHHPEFTSCEAYAVDLDYADMMTMTENLFRAVVVAVNRRKMRVTAAAATDAADAAVATADGNNGGDDADAALNRFSVHDPATGDSLVCDARQPFQRIDVMQCLHAHLCGDGDSGDGNGGGVGVSLPDPNCHSPATVQQWFLLCQRRGIALTPPTPPPPSSSSSTSQSSAASQSSSSGYPAADAGFLTPYLLDKLIGDIVEPLCVAPTLVTNHPLSLSPLAKAHDATSAPDMIGLTERFEFFVGGRELANAYSELNDPAEQRRRLVLQAALSKPRHDADAVTANVAAAAAAAATDVATDDVAEEVYEHSVSDMDDVFHPPDEAFCRALEHGLPPTAGWGIGIDRLVMLMTQQTNLREVLMFPLVRPPTTTTMTTTTQTTSKKEVE
jgi:lysyl-tRNA synthetase class 2